MIMKYIGADPTKHDTELGNKIDASTDYQEARKTLLDSLSALDKKTRITIEDQAGYVEVVARDISYDEGFREGVRFIMGCMSKEGVFQYE